MVRRGTPMTKEKQGKRKEGKRKQELGGGDV
jgi:hypothetical protein